jgi:hypothetical protein
LEHEHLKLHRAYTTLQQLLQALQYRPEAEAAAIFRRIREGDEIESIARHVEAGHLLMQLHVDSETRNRFEVPFGSEMPAFLNDPRNPYLQSLLHKAILSPSGLQLRQAGNTASKGKRTAHYLEPYQAATIVDARLDTVKPSLWTRVSDNDASMRKLLRLYFHYEYEWLSFFHKDHFLDDMLSGSEMFCSSLLVNAVLAVACVCTLHFPEFALKVYVGLTEVCG